MSTDSTNHFRWHALQKKLRECTKEEEVQRLIDDERKGPNRSRWLLRMQGRLRVLRNARENEEILSDTTSV